MSIDDKISEFKNMGDYYKALGTEKREKEAKKAMDSVMKFEDNMSDFYVNVIKPAHDEFLAVLDKETKQLKKTYGKEKALKMAFSKALEAFFKKAMPSVVKSIKDIKDPGERYKVLAQKYDVLMTGFGEYHKNEVMQGMAEGYASAKGVSRAKFIEDMDQRNNQDKGRVKEHLKTHYRHTTLGHHNPEEISKVAHGEMVGKGFEMESPGIWHGKDKHSHYRAYKGAVTGDWGIDPETRQPVDPKYFGFKKAKAKK